MRTAQFLFPYVLILFIGTSISFKKDTLVSQKPNILFIAIDDMLPLMKAYGYSNAKTPNLNKLAKSSTVFLNAYCQFPVCGPSRANLLTGTRPEENGVIDFTTRMRDLNKDILTLPQHFKNNGYTTVARGKIFDPRCVESKVLDDPQSWSIPYVPIHSAAEKQTVKILSKSLDLPDEELADGMIANAGIKLLQDLTAKNDPFFLAVGFKKPHLPFFAPKKYWDLYKRNNFKIHPFQRAPLNADSTYTLNNNNEFKEFSPFPAQGSPDAALQKEMIHGYYACVSYVDAQIGRLVEALKKSGKADNTIIVLWSDHGFQLGEHGQWGKHATLESANKVPFMICAPGYKGGKTNSLTELLDIFPTLCELASIEIPKKLQGKSQVAVMKNKKMQVKNYAISQYQRKGAFGYSIRTEKYRYTEWVNLEKVVVYKELYDLNKIAYETENLADKAAYTDILKSMAELLRSHSEGLKRLN